MKHFLPAIVLALASACSAQDPEVPEFDWKIHVEIHAVTLPAKTARGLLPQLRDEQQMPDAWKQVEALVDSGEAKLTANPSAQGTHGSDLTLAAGEELSYPSDVANLEVVEPRQARIAAGRGAPATEGAQDIGFTPQTIAKRNLGLHFNTHAEVSGDGKRLVLTASLERTWLLRWDEFEVGRLRNNEKILFKLPRFGVVKAQSNLGVFAGERVLLSAHAVPDQPEMMELVVLRAWTTPRKQTPAPR